MSPSCCVTWGSHQDVEFQSSEGLTGTRSIPMKVTHSNHCQIIFATGSKPRCFASLWDWLSIVTKWKLVSPWVSGSRECKRKASVFAWLSFRITYHHVHNILLVIKSTLLHGWEDLERHGNQEMKIIENHLSLWPYHPGHSWSHLIWDAEQDRGWLVGRWENPLGGW